MVVVTSIKVCQNVVTLWCYYKRNNGTTYFGFSNFIPLSLFFSYLVSLFQNTLTYFFMLRSQRITTPIIVYYQIRKLCVLKPMTFNSLTSLFIQNIGLSVLLSRPHDRKYIMYMRNLFLLPSLFNRVVVERDDKFVKMG
jgi:hypothetical protein